MKKHEKGKRNVKVCTFKSEAGNFADSKTKSPINEIVTIKENNAGKARARWPIYESIKSLSGATGYPVSVLKEAKAKGCRAFLPGGRIDTGILIPFLNSMLNDASDLPPGVANWNEAKAKVQTQREQVKLEQDRGLTMPTAEARAQACAAMTCVLDELDRRRQEHPTILAGMTAEQIAEQLAKADTESRKRWEARFNEVGKTEAAK